jgi:hypothetical protein
MRSRQKYGHDFIEDIPLLDDMTVAKHSGVIDRRARTSKERRKNFFALRTAQSDDT